ncbi:MAG: hypothetical protein ACTSW7_03450 [Candidatus Thorarchaeota archaeon]
MNVKLEGDIAQLLEHRIKEDGDFVVAEGEDLFVSSSNYTNTIFCGFVKIPELLKSSYELTKKKKHDFVVSKWYDGKWSCQTLIGFMLPTLMNNNLGVECDTGYAGRYIDDKEEKFSSLFSSQLILPFYQGFVSFLCCVEESSISVNDIFFGLPGGGFFATLEGVKNRVSNFLIGETPRLQESWIASLLLSRYPFPSTQKKDRIFIDEISLSKLKHLYLAEYKHTKSHFVDGNFLGYATAWGKSLSGTGKRVLSTLDSIEAKEKQYRTDIVQYASQAWHFLQLKNLV